MFWDKRMFWDKHFRVIKIFKQKFKEKFFLFFGFIVFFPTQFNQISKVFRLKKQFSGKY